MKKKILGALLSIAMIGTLFTGCGQQQGEVEKEASKKESADKGESGFEPVAKEDLKVGVIHIGDPADGSGYSYAHDLGNPCNCFSHSINPVCKWQKRMNKLKKCRCHFNGIRARRARNLEND